MEYKTSLLNLVFGYMNKTVVMFRTKGEVDRYLNNKIIEENYLINNNINKYFFFRKILEQIMRSLIII